MSAPMIDLTGKIFGELTVIRLGEKKSIGKKKTIFRTTWICKCSCGKEISLLPAALLQQKKVSCGCKSIKHNFTDLTGNKYGYLTIINKSDKKTKTRGVIWNCLCDCGNYVQVPTNSLTSGNKLTCSIKKHSEMHEMNPRRFREGDLPVSHFNAIKQNAIKRNLTFEVTIEYLWNLFLKQDKKCPLSGIQLNFTEHNNTIATRSITTASLDRIDSSKGYIEGNVQWTHKDVNKMKSNKSDKDFIDMCKKCVLNSYLKNDKLRPLFDEYFMNIALDVSLRSDDPDVKHGAVIVSNNNYIIGTGYNATIKGADPTMIPYNIRDEKRLWMIHAEENAILNSSSNPNNIGGAKIYVTAKPCVNCLQRIINFGITQIYYINRFGSITENEKTEQMRLDLIKMSKVSMIEIDINNIWKIKGF